MNALTPIEPHPQPDPFIVCKRCGSLRSRKVKACGMCGRDRLALSKQRRNGGRKI